MPAFDPARSAAAARALNDALADARDEEGGDFAFPADE
eukprot:gene1721-5552_t